jgi:hypothetical protein
VAACVHQPNPSRVSTRYWEFLDMRFFHMASRFVAGDGNCSRPAEQVCKPAANEMQPGTQ